LPTAKIRSLRMDCKVWKPSLIQLMKSVGNENANSLLEANISDVDRIDNYSDMSVPTIITTNTDSNNN